MNVLLINRDGTLVKRFPPVSTPEGMEDTIKAML